MEMYFITIRSAFKLNGRCDKRDIDENNFHRMN